jgi:hypothetical protein
VLVSMSYWPSLCRFGWPVYCCASIGLSVCVVVGCELAHLPLEVVTPPDPATTGPFINPGPSSASVPSCPQIEDGRLGGDVKVACSGSCGLIHPGTFVCYMQRIAET